MLLIETIIRKGRTLGMVIAHWAIPNTSYVLIRNRIELIYLLIGFF